MSLAVWEFAGNLYLARGDEVAPSRPYFTGDVLSGVPIPGVQDDGVAIIIAHPCSMRGRGAQMLERILVAAVSPHDPVPAHHWSKGFYDRMPLPELRGEEASLDAARLDQAGNAASADIARSERIACLSPVGVNMLQQRLVFHLTRVEIPTSVFWDAFAHTFEEADLLEEWVDELTPFIDADAAAAEFEAWVRSNSRQQRLRDPQQRAPVRSELRAELRRRRES